MIVSEFETAPVTADSDDDIALVIVVSEFDIAVVMVDSVAVRAVVKVDVTSLTSVVMLVSRLFMASRMSVVPQSDMFMIAEPS